MKFNQFLILFIIMSGCLLNAASYRSGEVVRVSEGDTLFSDLIVASRVVEIQGNLQGDVYSGSQELTVEGEITDDLIAAGVKASFQKDVNGDAVLPTAGATYLESKFSFMAPKGYGGFNNQSSDQEHLLKVYVKQSGATAANFSKALDGLDAVIAAI